MDIFCTKIFKEWGMDMKRKLLSLLTSLMLSCSLVAFLPGENSVSAANDDYSIQQDNGNIIYSVDEQDNVVHSDYYDDVVSVDESYQAEIDAINSDASDSIDAASNTFVTKTGTRYGYNYLGKCTNGAKRQQFYNAMYDTCVKIWNQTLAPTNETYTAYSSGKSFYFLAKVNYATYGLTRDQAVETYTIFKRDQPAFYYIATTVAYSSKFIGLLMPKDYKAASTRKSLQSTIMSYVSKATSGIKANYTNYYKALTLNNYLCKNMEYAYDSPRVPSTADWAHNVVGPAQKKKGVCEAYAKMYQMLLNYIGVENVYITGLGNTSGHAWNMVKLDNGNYYYVDTTWNDSSNNKYFARGETFFKKGHTPYTPKNTHLQFQYTLPTVPAADYNGIKTQYKFKPGEYTKQLTGVKVTNNEYATLTLNWGSYYASGVYVYQYNTKTKKYNLIATVPGNTNTYKVTNLTPGTTYTFQLKTFYNYNGKKLVSDKVSTVKGKTLSLPSGSPSVVRYADTDRYGTAVKIAGAVSSKSGYAVIASGTNYADALAGVPLATALEAPILLSSKDSLDSKTLNTIKTRKVTKVIILGGNVAISNKVVNQLKKLGIKAANIERIAGNDRYQTAVKIAQKLVKVTKKNPENVFFVSANGFADALSISSVAAVSKSPILYINQQGTLDKSTSNFLASIKKDTKNSYVIGGPKAIDNKALTNIKKQIKYCSRVYGSDRYYTCEMIYIWFKYRYVKGANPVLATGLNYPDALAGGVVAARMGSPIILVGNELEYPQNYILKSMASKAKKVYVLGGNAVVTNQLAYSAAATIAKAKSNAA